MEWIKLKDLSELQPGDMVRHVTGAKALIVTGNYGTHVTAILTQDITNPSKWVKIKKD